MVRAKLYFGQPSEIPSSTSPVRSPAMCFGTVDDCRKWLEDRRKAREMGHSEARKEPPNDLPNDLPSDGSSATGILSSPVEKAEAVESLRCVCSHWRLSHVGGTGLCRHCNCWAFEASLEPHVNISVTVKENGPMSNPTDSGKKCRCTHTGMDGTVFCSPMPHEHRIKLPKAKSPENKALKLVVCDNHLSCYLENGWVEVPNPICTICTSCEPMAGDTICEGCAIALSPRENDAIRMGEQGLCINHQTVHACLTTAKPGSNLCEYCENYMKLAGLKPSTPTQTASKAASSGAPASSSTDTTNQQRNPKIRTIPTSARPCQLTNGCAGTMVAHIVRFSYNSKPELWWNCAVCSVRQIALKTRAIHDPRLTAVEKEAVEDAAIAEKLKSTTAQGPVPLESEAESVDPDMNEFTDAVRGTVRSMLGGSNYD